MKSFDSKTYLIHGSSLDWALITICDTGKESGLLQITSDYGNWSYQWGSMGSDIRSFLITISDNYLIDKLTMDKPNDRKFFEFDKTITEMKRQIIEMRKDNYITKELARDAYDEVLDLEKNNDYDQQNVDSFSTYILNYCTYLWKVFDYESMPCVCVYSPQIVMFIDRLWSVFKDQLKLEIIV